MTTAVANPDDPKLRSFLVYSIVFHAVFSIVVIGVSFFERRGQEWGGPGGNFGGTKVSLVPSSGIPMLKQPNVTESKAVDPTQGLHKEEPKKPPELKTDAEKIPTFKKETRLPPSAKSRTLENKTPVHDNDVPYGGGGNPNIPTGPSQTPGGSPGVSTIGQGGGDFGSRYPWYVDAVRSRVRQVWDQSTIDPATRAGRRAHAVVTFRISSNGSVSNIRMSQTSGNSSMDYSALRALQNIDSFRPLPNDYMGSYVDVTFDFDLSLAQ